MICICIPFWASSNFAEITSKKVVLISDRNYISRLATGTMESDCPKPCKISKVCKVNTAAKYVNISIGPKF